MQTLKRILVAVDFSSCSLLALERAWELAQRCAATIDILHVYEVPSYVAPGTLLIGGSLTTSQSLEELLRVEAERGLAKCVEEARSRGIRVASARASRGDTAGTILQSAEDGKYDLIALGTHGRTGLQHVLLGSIAEKIVRRSTRPVLTVREMPPAQAA
jgi:nucleotide-binding universal stress UspA family protein